MKVKDLIGINPEADIVIYNSNGMPIETEPTFGWSSTEADVNGSSKENALEVVIFVGKLMKENA